MNHIGIIGAGAWGTALAKVAAANGPVTLWAYEPEVADEINAARENATYLPGVMLPDGIRATADLADLAACDAFLVVTPAQRLRIVLEGAPIDVKPLLICAKGIERGSGLLPSEIARNIVPQSPRAVLSGPTFASEVAAGKPAAVTLASRDPALVQQWTDRLASPAFRLYGSDDPIGASVGGAVKNVLAIACGIVLGRDLGENARAALISRGFIEMARYAVARGAKAETLTGLSGLGDLVLTCGSEQSRNMSLGVALGRGERTDDVLGNRRSVAEGALTAPILASDAAARGVDMPIVAAVADLIAGRAQVETAIEQLLARPMTSEL